ncbi:Crp/Fnr family transcriptional regulator [Acetobacteraceae bacterium H6797]|nr:Crp/Fnr family transcriptional regulator [Acetobacteraceae bacterium H6797]
METTLSRKLEQFIKLSSEDRSVLYRLSGERVRRFGAREDVIREGDAPKDVYLLLSGWACRYKQLEDGRRQIVAFFLPGDLCDLNIYILKEMDHSVGTLTPATFAEITRSTLEEVVLNHPRVAQGLWWETLVNIAIQREWTVNLGQRSAFERMAHLLCELYIRLRAVGLTKDGGCELPFTQVDLADAMGLSPVHVNRTLQELRGAGLIVLRDKWLEIPDLDAIKNAAMFNPNYLHLERGPHEQAARVL